MQRNKKLTTWLLAVVAHAVLFGLVLLIRGIYTLQGFSDASFISGFMMIAFSGLSFIGRSGTFDFLSYTFVRLIDGFKKPGTKTYVDAYEYQEHKRTKRINKRFYWLPYVVVPLVYLMFALITTLIITNQ